MKFKDMTSEEAKKLVGKEMWKKMQDTGLLSGITGVIVDSKFLIYKYDLEHAYEVAKSGRKIILGDWD
ncbi:MAG: hypothetical protein AABX74_05330 [Nanoarchaeota archaeon]